jgi:hypothetical protein
MTTRQDVKKYTFEILTVNGEWRPISGRSGNSIDIETGCSVFAASENGRPHACYGIEAANGALDHFGKIAGHHRVRIANGKKFKATAREMKGLCDDLNKELAWEKALKIGYREAFLQAKSAFELPKP